MTSSTRDHRRSRDLCPPTALFWKSVCTLSCLSVVCNACPLCGQTARLFYNSAQSSKQPCSDSGEFCAETGPTKFLQLARDRLDATQTDVCLLPVTTVSFLSNSSASCSNRQLRHAKKLVLLSDRIFSAQHAVMIQPMQQRYRRVVQFVWVGSVSLPVCLSGLLAADLPRWPGRGKSIADQLDPTSITDDHTSSINPLTLTDAIWVQL